MGKTWQTRWNDTIAYLNANFAFDQLGTHVASVVQPAQQQSISDELSLGSKASGTTGKRHAMRGLLLCQRVYFSDMWAHRTWDLKSYVKDSTALKPNWKAQSIAFWGGKTEADILRGVAMFVPVQGASRQDLVLAAKGGPPTGVKGEELPGNLFLSRADTDSKGAAETCYNGVTAWLLKSGIVSMRWIMSDTAPNGQAACDRLFGTGTEVWGPATAFKDDSVLPPIDAGYIVHMWMEETGVAGWNGHWVVSNGDGTICGVNNGEVKTSDELVLKKYTNTGKLRSQFEGYGGYLMTQKMNDRGFLDLVPVEPKKYARARMAKFDPLQLPNRL
jgi:hypothetical protein